MSKRSATHATFVIERDYDAPPARVFAAWADQSAKSRWFGPTGGGEQHELDFRVGGREHFVVNAGERACTATTRSTKTSWRTSASSTPTTCTATRSG